MSVGEDASNTVTGVDRARVSRSAYPCAYIIPAYFLSITQT